MTQDTDGFTAMLATARAFTADLAQNNDRDWFEGRKARFKSDIEAPLKLLTDLFAEDLSVLTGRGHVGKTGRIYRDTRFSRDKSPYNTYLHAYWQPSAGSGPGWLLHIDAQGARFMTGLHALDADGLVRYRAAVDRDGDRLAEAVAAGQGAGAALIDFGETALKRVPRPFDPDHPLGDFLRRKQIALGLALDESRMTDGLIPALSVAARALLPFRHWCNAAIA